MGQRIVIIGAGIIGAAVALRLTQAGHDVTVIEAGAPGGGATGRSFGWINASFHQDAAHFALRAEGMAAWRRLDLPGVSWPGCLWFEEQGDAFASVHKHLTSLGYPVEVLESDAIARAEPALAAPPARALRFPGEGVAEAALVAQDLLARATALGARLWSGIAVRGIADRAGRVGGVLTDAGAIAADTVLVCAGTGTPGLVGPLGVKLPMLDRPGLLLTTQALPPLLGHIVVAPGQEVRQLPDGRLLAPTSPNHQGDAAETLADTAETLAEAARARVAALIGRDIRLTGITLAHRPVPGDGLPVVGPSGPDGLYLAVMHSGVTLAAIMAELIAAELTNGGPQALLAPYRPARFA
ncbi:MAG: FAD-binding oxidoreductase [Rhodobacteraceae bacterium]|nr:MAG: FAD-binding oxidoreductase [Paracoccaceae bacterium]